MRGDILYRIRCRTLTFASRLQGAWIHTLAFACDKRMLVVGGADEKITLWEITQGTKLRELAHEGEVAAAH